MSYLKEQLTSLNKLPAVVETNSPLETELLRLLLSKHFRKYSVTPEYKEHIAKAISQSVAQNKPIELVWVFGGYKLWRLPECPEVDWAELFSLFYFTSWLKPILALYKPGVWFDFYSDDGILETMNNIPKKDTEAYLKSFKQLLSFLKPYLPKNLTFTLNRVIDQYDSPESFLIDLENSKKQLVTKLDGKLPTLSEEQKAAITLNVKLTPNQAADPKWQEKVQLMHDSYAAVSKRRPYYRTASKIMVTNMPIKDCIAVGTTKTSVAKFWVGVGAVAKEENGYKNYVLSPHQLETRAFKIEAVLLPKLTLKNFKKIRVIGD